MANGTFDPSFPGLKPSDICSPNFSADGATGGLASATMTHPGLPTEWAIGLWGIMILAGFLVLWRPVLATSASRYLNIGKIPIVGAYLATVVTYATRQAWVLFSIRLAFVAVFLIIIAAGLFGSPFPERNAATVLTWNLWWTGLILSIFFSGSAWCGVCPWNSLANWIVKKKIWRRASEFSSLNIRLPRWLKTIWPAFFLLVGLTWLELGVGVTVDPFTTAVLALMILVAATASLAIYERNAFCHYFCPVGRTVGFYAQLAPIELRPIDSDICAGCTTLECYYGSEDVDACPTHQVMGRLQQNTYCTSCGNCARSCPEQNVAWRLRSPSTEAIQDARPHWDEAWFMVGLLALTGFHGLTMMSFWEDATISVARAIGDGGQMLTTFSLSLMVALAIPALIYVLAIALVKLANDGGVIFSDLFCRFAFIALPLAFAYHLAHNLNHLLSEGQGLVKILSNPFGKNLLPATISEKHAMMMDQLLSPMTIHAIQAALLAFGVLIALRVIQKRSGSLPTLSPLRARLQALPLVLFTIGATGYHLWLLMQPMIMRI